MTGRRRWGAVVPIRRVQAAPSGTSAPDQQPRAGSIEARLATRLDTCGARYTGFAAAVLVCRGRRLLDQAGFARLVGVPVAHVRSWESGRRPPTDAPRRLASLDPAIDWGAAGVLPPGDVNDPASRHPAAGRHR